MTGRLTLGAVLYEKFELLDLYGPLEMFGAIPGAFDIVTVSDQPGAVASAQGPRTVADVGFADCPPLDLVLVPGGIGTLAALENEALLDFLRERAKSARTTMSVCSGSAILARAGLLDGRRATSNKQLFQFAVEQGDKVQWVESARWVEDGPFVTASGVSAGTDMALAVIAGLRGEEFAQNVADFTEYQWHRDAAIDPFARFLNAMDANALAALLD
ncbi:MAG: DJ-1/PfpI family protein [Halioglobus sp.]|nr:DJ-1/PfpI family protein [Halioglobus sp.]